MLLIISVKCAISFASFGLEDDHNVDNVSLIPASLSFLFKAFLIRLHGYMYEYDWLGRAAIQSGLSLR